VGFYSRIQRIDFARTEKGEIRITLQILDLCKSLSTEMFVPFLNADKRHWILFQGSWIRTSSPDIVRFLCQDRHKEIKTTGTM
jgi:hypothetical protein